MYGEGKWADGEIMMIECKWTLIQENESYAFSEPTDTWHGVDHYVGRLTFVGANQ